MLNNRLPYGNAKLYLGIASVLLSPALLGFVLGVISVYLVDKDTKMLHASPGSFSDSAKRNHKSGVTAAWAGFIVSAIMTVLILYLFGKFGTLNPDRFRF